MISRDKVLKIDIITSEDTRILSVGSRQFALQEYEGGTSFRGENDMILIIKGKGLPEIERNSSLFVIISMKNSQRIKYPAYVSASTDMQLNIIVKTALGEILQERRRYYKVEVDIPCVINIVERNGNRTVLESPYLTRIKDINIGGVFLNACNGEEFQKNDHLMLSIDLNEKSLDMEAEILRVQKNAAGDVTGYGCKFLNTHPSDEDVISRYVIELQHQQIKKEHENM